jgi:Zn-dependent protease with chaperone function
MLLFLFFDFLFSSSIAYYTARSISIAKNKEDSYRNFSEIFEIVRAKFSVPNVELYIEKTDNVNAYAVGSLRRNVVVLTTGLVNSYRLSQENREEFLMSIEGIMAHEMSHIANKDYFLALMLLVNERATGLVSKIIDRVFRLLARIFEIIPVVGQYIALAIDCAYGVLDFSMRFFYRFIMLNLYSFIQLQISKSVEYRADRQAAMVIGGQNMARALSPLGNGGYFSIFSSHPLTSSRIKKVAKVNGIEDAIKPVFGTNLTFLLSFVTMVTIIHFSYRAAKIHVILEAFRSMVLFVRNKYIFLKSTLMILKQKFLG